MRSNDMLILAIAGVAAWFIVRAAQGATATTQTAQQSISAESLAWYLNDIYARLPA